MQPITDPQSMASKRLHREMQTLQHRMAYQAQTAIAALDVLDNLPPSTEADEAKAAVRQALAHLQQALAALSQRIDIELSRLDTQTADFDQLE